MTSASSDDQMPDGRYRPRDWRENPESNGQRDQRQQQGRQRPKHQQR
jgi:hypothetical protein